jgi:hypothetical protein
MPQLQRTQFGLFKELGNLRSSYAKTLHHDTAVGLIAFTQQSLFLARLQPK